MQTRDLIGFVVLAVMLLTAAWTAQLGYIPIWHGSQTISVPWILSSLAIALLVVASIGVLLRTPPGHVPRFAALAAIIWILALLGIGLIGDGISRSQFASTLAPGEIMSYEDLVVDAIRLLGFGVLLVGAFVLPRTLAGTARETRCRACDHILRGLKEPRCPECGEAI